ncbi:hypothetical protein [Mycetocola zhujimingii]|uniref:hypothetical protein n=1 Tax=Mycetocola zhujimingii TaxID=2079792 RepID=UPI001304ABD6|nr:hypothetical protein [Mycetocola zhujimingii]
MSVDDIAQDGASNSSSNSASDSAPFSWSLTPNDQLDPIVHSSSSDAPSSPQPAGSAALTAPAEPPEPLRARREPAGTVPAVTVPPVTVPPVTVPAVTEPADTEPAEAEPTEAEPAELDPGTGEAVADPRGGTDPELPQLPDEPESSEFRPAKRGSAGYDTDSLAFLMELEAAAASASAASGADPDSDPDADRATNTTPDTDAKPETGIRGSAADARRGPISAAGLPTSEFNQETFGGLVPPSGVGPTSQERERPERAARTERPERAERRSGRPATPPLPPVVKWVALGLAVVLVFVALFFLGTRLPSLFGSSGSTPAAAATTTTATPTETPSPTPTPTTPPVETVAAIGPVAPGEHKWNALLGGECLEPYTTPWAEKFAVVDCATAHAAQMVFTAPVTSDPAAAYPGEAEIAAEISLWCSAPGVLDSAAAGAYSDLQVQGTYPVSAEQWAEGERNYYCFISRSTGEALTGTLAVAQPAT